MTNTRALELLQSLAEDHCGNSLRLDTPLDPVELAEALDIAIGAVQLLQEDAP